MKNSNKSRDMSKAKYTRFVKCNLEQLLKIVGKYNQIVYKVIEDVKYGPACEYCEFDRDYAVRLWTGTYSVVLKATMCEWNDIVDDLGLKVIKGSRQKRDWTF